MSVAVAPIRRYPIAGGEVQLDRSKHREAGEAARPEANKKEKKRLESFHEVGGALSQRQEDAIMRNTHNLSITGLVHIVCTSASPVPFNCVGDEHRRR